MAAMWRSRHAFARFFVGKPGQILNNAIDFGTKLAPASQSVAILNRNSSNYAHSQFVHKVKEQYEFEIVKNPPEWTYVERLLPFATVPKVTPKASYPSGWKPSKEEAVNHPYFIARNKNHELPIYLDLTFKGQRKITQVKKIEGDIWLLNDEIKYICKNKAQKYVETRVHELAKIIEVKGDYVNVLKNWAYSKGF